MAIHKGNDTIDFHKIKINKKVLLVFFAILTIFSFSVSLSDAFIWTKQQVAPYTDFYRWAFELSLAIYGVIFFFLTGWVIDDL